MTAAIAYADFAKAANLDPFYRGRLAFASKKRATVYKENGDFKKALTDYSKAIKLEPLNGFYYKFRADTCRELEKNKAALADYTQAIYLIAEYDSAGEDSDWAEEDSDWKEKADDEFLAELYNVRGDVNKALENFEQAKSDYRKALRIAINSKFENMIKERYGERNIRHAGGLSKRGGGQVDCTASIFSEQVYESGRGEQRV